MTQGAMPGMEELFAGGGEMGALTRAFNWASTPLGPMKNWPQSLRITLSICLTSCFPMILMWGSEFIQLYNDAYCAMFGLTEHQTALGQPAYECCSKVWHIIVPALKAVFTSGQASGFANERFMINRNGYLEECYFTFSMTPVQNEIGNVVGIFTTITETTQQITSERRLRTLQDLAAIAPQTKTVKVTCTIATEILAQNQADIPFCLLYLLDEENQQVNLMGSHGLAVDTSASPRQIHLDRAAWPLARVVNTKKAETVTQLAKHFANVEEFATADAPHSALILPLAQPGQKHLLGMLIVGVSPWRSLNSEYQGFFEMIATQVATAIAKSQDSETLAGLSQAQTAFFNNYIKPFSGCELLPKAAQCERLRAEAEIAHRHISNILESITDAFVAFDRQWRYTYVNQSAAKILQRSPQELIGKNIWEEVFLSAVDELAYQEMHRAVAQQVPISWEEFCQPLQCWLEVKAYPFKDGLALYFRDITERKRAEAGLRQSEEQFRQLADAMPQIVWTSNADGKLEYVNQNWREYAGLSLEQGRRRENSSLVIHPDDVQSAYQEWEKSLAAGTSYQKECRMKRAADGVFHWFLVRAIPIKDEQGRVIKWYGTSTDIHDRKLAEQEREKLLQREQIAREQAETANRIKDEFLAVLSHELRSPLNPILGWANLLRTRKFDEKTTDRALETIERNAKLQAQLIEDLLDVSRILQGKMVLNICPVNLISVIEAALETVQLATEAKGIKIQKLLATDIKQVSGDAGRLQQIIWNLLTNAVKFTPPGGQVEVRLEQDGMYAKIQVKDNGKGITSEFLPYVFEYFRQEDGSTTRNFGGLGLGLAIVRHITELHDGTVEVESPGENLGAVFTVKLPVSAIAFKTTPDFELPIDTPNLNGLRILVVDDEADMLDLLRVILEKSGAEVCTAASPTKALTMLDQCQPDVLISDIGMPRVDGYILMQQVKERLAKQGKEIKAIALTAYAGEINRQQALAAGFERHISKPVEPQVLVRAISDLIGLGTGD